MSDAPKAAKLTGEFIGWALVFCVLAVLPSLAAFMVLSEIVESGLSGNLSYTMFLVMPMTPVVVIQGLVYLRLVALSQTQATRAVLIALGCLLAFDATLLLGWGMHASGC